MQKVTQEFTRKLYKTEIGHTMHTWKHYNPVEIIANIHAYEELPRCISEYSFTQGKVLLVTSAGMVRRKTVENVMQNISCPWHIFEAKSEPDLDDLDVAICQLRQLETSIQAGQIKKLKPVNMEQVKGVPFSAVIALGGGSVIDSAKALACGIIATDLEKPLNAWLREKKKISSKALPLIAIPTNAGTGAEMTPFATIWDNKNKKKCSLVSRACFPKTALFDPSLTLSLPWKETLYGALDAFSHALETLWNKTATPMSLSCAHTALSLIMENLPLVRQNLQNISARSKLQEAACIAGMAISQSHSSIGHSISYPLTLHHKIQHGLSCSAFLLPIMNLVEKHNAWMLPLDMEFKANLRHFLQIYEPHKLVREFCTEAQAQSLVHEMFTPERAGTFMLDLKTDDVVNILNHGFTL